MIECLCIDDSFKPNEVPRSKWIKEGEIYNIIYTVTVLPQNELAFYLAEIDLDESCSPYHFFLSKRFAIRSTDINKLHELIKNCSDTDFSINRLLEETNIQKI